jgi:hypothetical protein
MFLQRSSWYFFFIRECGKRLENSASAARGTKHTQVRHAFFVTSLKAPVAESDVTSVGIPGKVRRRKWLGGGWSLSVQQVDPRAANTPAAVSRNGYTDANFMYISRVPFPGCRLCSLERKNTDFSL